MKLFKTTQKLPDIASTVSSRVLDNNMTSFVGNVNSYENQLYESLRVSVPIIDACINKIIRLTGNFKVVSSDEKYQCELDNFIQNVKVGISGQSLYSFMDCFLDSLLTYGKAVGEIIINPETYCIEGLYNADSTNISIKSGTSPVDTEFFIGSGNSSVKIKNPERLVFCTLNPTPKNPEGISILRGLPAISGILTRIYECIGQNFDRVGNVRYAVTYKPSIESGDKAFAKERAMQIAQEWSLNAKVSSSQAAQESMRE